jgi:hypothetical protein
MIGQLWQVVAGYQRELCGKIQPVIPQCRVLRSRLPPRGFATSDVMAGRLLRNPDAAKIAELCNGRGSHARPWHGRHDSHCSVVVEGLQLRL